MTRKASLHSLLFLHFVMNSDIQGPPSKVKGFLFCISKQALNSEGGYGFIQRCSFFTDSYLKMVGAGEVQCPHSNHLCNKEQTLELSKLLQFQKHTMKKNKGYH